MVDEVLRTEPDHQEALRVRAELLDQDSTAAAKSAPADKTAVEKAEPSVPPSATASSLTTDYVPEGFVETTGEEIQTGKPPQSTLREDPTLLEHVGVSESPPSSIPAESEPYDAADIPESQRLTEVPGVTEEVISAVDVMPQPSQQDEPSGVMEKPFAYASDAADSTPPQSSDSPVAPKSPDVSRAPALVLRHIEDEVHAYWELPESVLAHCGVDPQEGEACLKIVAIIPAGSHPERRELTYFLHQGDQLGPDSGQMKIEAIGPSAAVRAALGWISGDSFLPLCVGKSLAQLSSDVSNEALLARVRRYWS
jgi:hypothetical protein